VLEPRERDEHELMLAGAGLDRDGDPHRLSAVAEPVNVLDLADLISVLVVQGLAAQAGWVLDR
jgi:hypothetical protein